MSLRAVRTCRHIVLSHDLEYCTVSESKETLSIISPRDNVKLWLKNLAIRSIVWSIHVRVTTIVGFIRRQSSIADPDRGGGPEFTPPRMRLGKWIFFLVFILYGRNLRNFGKYPGIFTQG